MLDEGSCVCDLRNPPENGILKLVACGQKGCNKVLSGRNLALACGRKLDGMGFVSYIR